MKRIVDEEEIGLQYLMAFANFTDSAALSTNSELSLLYRFVSEIPFGIDKTDGSHARKEPKRAYKICDGTVRYSTVRYRYLTVNGWYLH